MRASLRSCGETVYLARCQSQTVASHLPSPLAPVGDEFFLYLVSACLKEEPGFDEANLVIPCQGPSGPGTYFLRAWFEEPRLIELAASVGWPARTARIRVPRIPFATRSWAWPPQQPVAGGVDGEFELRLQPGPAADPPPGMLTVYGVREGRAVVEVHPRERVVGAWSAAAELELKGEAAELVGDHRVLAGAIVEIGIELGGYR